MNTKNAGLLVIALIVILGVGVILFSSKGKENVKQSTSSELVKTSETAQRVSYKNGVYEQKGDYSSPAGPEQIDVVLTLKDGIITEATVTPQAENPKSKYMQGVFVENYKQLVVGKSIKDLNLGKVAGSSLTPKGFNDAIAKIKAKAS